MSLHIIRDEIAELAVDAIVIHTNAAMDESSWINKQVYDLAGPKLARACKKQAPLDLGFAAITPGYKLKSKYVIHTHRPHWYHGHRGNKALVKSCYLESLKLACRYNCTTVAVSIIPTVGVMKKYSLRDAAETIAEFLGDHNMEVYLCISEHAHGVFDMHQRQDITKYIDDHLKDERECEALPQAKFRKRSVAFKPEKPIRHRALDDDYDLYDVSVCAEPGSLQAYMDNMDAGFADTLFALIDQSGMTDVECYKKANIDKKLFSKIRSRADYKPSKQTALAFAIALELDLQETQSLLRTIGMTLSHSNKFDLIVEYFIVHGKYNIYEINEALFEFDQPLLGSV